MRIRMRKDTYGSTDGVNAVLFEKGKTYETREGESGDNTLSLPQSLAESFLRDGDADEVKLSRHDGAATVTVDDASKSKKPGPKEIK